MTDEGAHSRSRAVAVLSPDVPGLASDGLVRLNNIRRAEDDSQADDFPIMWSVLVLAFEPARRSGGIDAHHAKGRLRLIVTEALLLPLVTTLVSVNVGQQARFEPDQ